MRQRPSATTPRWGTPLRRRSSARSAELAGSGARESREPLRGAGSPTRWRCRIRQVRNATLKTASQSLLRQSRKRWCVRSCDVKDPDDIDRGPSECSGMTPERLLVCAAARQYLTNERLSGTVVKARYPVFCATVFSAGFSLAVLALTASAVPWAASRVTLRAHGQGI